MSAPAGSRPTPEPEPLERALAEAGLRCTVEARERLAVIVPVGDSAAAFADRARRDLALRLAAAQGFTHLAVELPRPAAPAARPAAARAALSRP